MPPAPAYWMRVTGVYAQPRMRAPAVWLGHRLVAQSRLGFSHDFRAEIDQILTKLQVEAGP